MTFTNGIYADRVDRVITAQADGEDISAGQFVIASGTSEVSETASLDGYVKVAVADAGSSTDSGEVVGIALEAISNGDKGAIATKGIFRVKSNSTIDAGSSVKKAETSDGYEVGSLTAGDAEEMRIGKVLVPSTADNGVVVIALNIG